MVVKIMVPVWILLHLIVRAPTKRTINLTTTHMYTHIIMLNRPSQFGGVAYHEVADGGFVIVDCS